MPALIVRVDLASKAVTVRPIDADTPPGKSLELWYVAAGQAPKSMGVLKKGSRADAHAVGDGNVRRDLRGKSRACRAARRPASATGPIVYKGALIPE